MTGLIKYETARRALAECKAMDEVKAWADKAAAMQAYGRMAKDKTLEVDAAEIRIRAERRLGEMLVQQKAEGGLNRGTAGAGDSNVGRGTGGRSSRPPVAAQPPTLADAGISKDLSSRSQKLAAVSEDAFEAEVSEWRERVQAEGERVTSRLERAGERALRAATEIEDTPVVTPDAALADDLDLLQELQEKVERLTGEIRAAEADDLKAEAMKWRRDYEVMRRRCDEHLATVASKDKQIKFLARQLGRCGKAVGVDDQDAIATAVEALARKNGKAVAA